VSAAIEWGSTAEERAASYPCEEFVPGATLSVFRAIDIAAPVLGAIYRPTLPWFDLFMMRKQFLNLKRRAEETAAAAQAGGVAGAAGGAASN